MSGPGEELRTALIPAARLPSLAVRVAARAVPDGALRDRYRQELLAELFGMPRGRQVRHSLGVLSHAWALRSALTDQHPAKELGMSTPRRPVLCRLHLHHSWRTRSTEDGGRYRQCVRCGKDQNPRRRGPGDWAGGNFGGGSGG